MNCLITGASGFVGRFLQKRLLRDGHRTVALTSDMADLSQHGALDPVTDERFDVIWHLAAYTRAGEFCRTFPGDQWLINQRINQTVLDYRRRVQPQARLVAFGTSVAYPPGVDLVEPNYAAGEPGAGYYGYATSKRSLLEGMRAISRQYDLHDLYLIPSTLYGPEYHLDGRPLHFIYDLIRKILLGRHAAQPVVLWGDGHQKRELVYIEDFIEVLLALLPVADNTLINIGSGREHTIREFADVICGHVGYDPRRIEYDTTAFVGARSKCLVVDRLDGLLPERPRTPLADGLARTIDWVWAHRQTLLPELAS